MNDWFCPLTKKDCNPYCICYRPKEVVQEKQVQYGGFVMVDKTIPEHCTQFMGPYRK